MGLTKLDAMRIELGSALRDLADEVERGDRTVLEYSTYERTAKDGPPISVLHLVTTIKPRPEK